MKRLSSLSAMAAMFAMLAPNLDTFRFMERPRSPGSRRVKKHKQPAGRSRYMPHYGAKEQERARRCYMHYTFSTADSFHHPLRLRSAPVLHQRSKLVQEFHDAGISWF